VSVYISRRSYDKRFKLGNATEGGVIPAVLPFKVAGVLCGAKQRGEDISAVKGPGYEGKPGTGEEKKGCRGLEGTGH